MIINVRWLAGFFDGEGSISVARQGVGHSKGRGRLAITLTQAGPIGLEVLTAIRDFIYIQGIRSTVLNKSIVEGSKQGYMLSITGWENGINFIVFLYPYLIVKRQLAQDTIRFSKVFPDMFRHTGWLARESRVNNLAANQSQ